MRSVDPVLRIRLFSGVYGGPTSKKAGLMKPSQFLAFAGNFETYFEKLFGIQPSGKAEAVCYSRATGITDNLDSEHSSTW